MYRVLGQYARHRQVPFVGDPPDFIRRQFTLYAGSGGNDYFPEPWKAIEQAVDAGKVRLMTNLDEGHRPYGEQEHQLNLALDLNSDGKPDYAEFTHHCKAEPAPYPIADEQRAAWEAEHGETDWDLTCTNVYTIDHGKWTKGERKTPA